ncbi:MAG: response regulator transcription factor [Aeromicrobium sp.]|nr:MAG: response regulator transcription factor [Aeromicrobium sp.]
MIRIVIADDHPIVRAGLRAVIDSEVDLDIVGEASTPSAAIELADSLAPDVILMDLQFGTDETGVDATTRIQQLPSAPHVLVLTNYDTDMDILGAVEAGAAGYLLKDAPPHELLAAIRAAAAGESALGPTIASRLLGRMRNTQNVLSPREQSVISLVADGATNADIARSLHISESTVKSHLVHIFTKLDATSRTSAVAEARSRGIIR